MSIKKSIDINGSDLADKIEQKKPIKIWLAIGLAALLGAAFLIYKQKNRHPDNAKISELKRLINRSFPIAEPNLCPLSQEKTKVITDENISMNINFISQLQNKTKTTLSSTRNPFLPPFEKGIMIAELPPKHRLLYNKFYFYKNHVLVVTQQYEDQTSRLSLEDLKQTLLVTLTINGVYFFNSGPESGYSQKHKHIQVLPSQAYKLPILSQIVKDIKGQNLQKLPYKSKQNIPIYLFKGYNFIHGIVLLPQSLEQTNIQQSAIALKQAEDTLFTHLGLLLKNNKFSYNVIGTPQFFMMIPRKSEKTVGEIGVNSICFMGSMLVKDEKFFQQIDKLCKPTSILRDITFTELPK